MQNMIDKAIKEREKQELVDPLLEECKQHLVFCQEKCLGFQGREDILKVWFDFFFLYYDGMFIYFDCDIIMSLTDWLLVA